MDKNTLIVVVVLVVLLVMVGLFILKMKADKENASNQLLHDAIGLRATQISNKKGVVDYLQASGNLLSSIASFIPGVGQAAAAGKGAGKAITGKG
jgi:hypothetical protein